MRTRGSVRFAPYYKVQVWKAVSLTWQDVQRQHATREDAEAGFPAGQRCRVVEVTPHGRTPLPER